MYLKLMSGENMPDASNDKGYRMIECHDAQFHPKWNDGTTTTFRPAVTFTDMRGLGQWLYLDGNVYVLNNAGKTIDSFWPHFEQKYGPSEQRGPSAPCTDGRTA